MTDGELTAEWRLRVRDCWRRVLQADDFTDDEDFFVAGGNSLLAARITADIARQTAGLRIPLRA